MEKIFRIILKIFRAILRKISLIIFYLTPPQFFKKREEDFFAFNYYVKKQIEDCFIHFEKFMEKAVHLNSMNRMREYAINNALLNDKDKNKFYLEFGVYKGTSANFFADFVKKLYAFDSFEGLREDWLGNMAKKGDLNLNKKIPKLKNNVEPIAGWVQETVEKFLEQHNPKINFIHMDLDTYESTKYVLEKIKPYLEKNAIILFDEFYNNPGWRFGEYKALQETFNENEYKFKAFATKGSQVVIEIIK